MTLPAGPRRWFEVSAVAEAVESLESEIAQIADDDRAGKIPAPIEDNSQKLAWGVLGIVGGMLVLLVLILALFGKRDPDHQIDARGYISLGGILIILPVGLYFGSKHFFGIRSKQLNVRREGLLQLMGRHPSLALGHLRKITGPSAGSIPWVASELDTVVECDLYGEYWGHRLAVVQCTYVVDRTLTAIESSLGGIASSVMSHVQHEHVLRWTLEGIVFLDPAPALPDAFSAAKKEPLNWYFKRQLQRSGEEDVRPLAGGDRWTVTSDPQQWSWAVQARDAKLYGAYPEAIVQVFGGYVVVIPQNWNANFPKGMAVDAEGIERNLSWACDVYEALRGGEVTARAVARPQTAERAPAALPARPEMETLAPAPPAPPRTAAKPRTLLQIFLGIGGFLMAGMGGIFLLGILALRAKVSGAADWPTVEGQVVSAKVQQRGGPQYSADIKYQYTVNDRQYDSDKRTMASTEWLDDKTAIESVVSQYKEGQPAKVYYNPRNHSEAVLEPRMADSGVETCVIIFSGLFVVSGMALMVVGIRRPR